jgi:hypothetical protein
MQVAVTSKPIHLDNTISRLIIAVITIKLSSDRYHPDKTINVPMRRVALSLGMVYAISGLIDRSFGFNTAVEEACKAVSRVPYCPCAILPMCHIVPCQCCNLLLCRAVLRCNLCRAVPCFAVVYADVVNALLTIDAYTVCLCVCVD